MQLTLIEQTAQIAAALGHGWARMAADLIPEIPYLDAAEYAAVLYITADEQDRPEISERYTMPGGITLAEAFTVTEREWVWAHETGTGRLRLFAQANHDDSQQYCRVEVHRPDKVVGGLGGSICVLRGSGRNFQELVGYIREGDVMVSGPDWEVAPLAEPRHHEAALFALRELIPASPHAASEMEDGVYVDKEMLAAFGVLEDSSSNSESQEE